MNLSPASDPRYPIGRFVRQDVYSSAERSAHVARLAAQPGALAAALDGLDEHDFAAPYRPGGWTVGQLVHHLADSHANAFIRVKLGLTEDEPTIKPYDQDAWVQLADATTLSPHVSVALFAATHIRLHAVLAGSAARPHDGGRALHSGLRVLLEHLKQLVPAFRAIRGHGRKAAGLGAPEPGRRIGLQRRLSAPIRTATWHPLPGNRTNPRHGGGSS
jgi:hypothetical protein